MNICEYFDNGQCRDDGCACMFEPDIRQNLGKVPEYLAWDCCPWYRVAEEETEPEAADVVGEADRSPASAPEKPVVEKKCLRCCEELKCLDDGMECLFDDRMSECPDYVPEGGTACGRCGTDGVCSHDGEFCRMNDHVDECPLYLDPTEKATLVEESPQSLRDSSPMRGTGEPLGCGHLWNGMCLDTEPMVKCDSVEACRIREDLEKLKEEEPEEDGRLKIVYIDVGLIDPAPWNRNIGDVSELAASIKAEGVHTPLTVCPHVQGLEDRYTAVAGNRRRAAAEKAGLQTVPCIVRPLSEVQILTMMLSENVNRKAMTPVEEANAMQQLMLQLPENTAAAVSRATGISKTTVGRRLKLAQLPGEALAQAEERGGTLADYEKIVSLTDPAEQEKVLKTVGTKDFDREYQKALTRQEDKAAFERHIATLEKKGAKRLTMEQKVARNAELSNEKTIYSWQLTTQGVGKLDRDEEWFFTAEDREIRIYKLKRQKPEEAPVGAAPSVSGADSSPAPVAKSDVDKAKEELEEAKREAREELDGIKAEANQMDQEFLELREGFVEKIMLNAYQEEIMEMAVMAMLYVPYWSGNRMSEVGEWLGVAEITNQVEVRKAVRGNPVKALLSVAYCLLEKDAGSWTKPYGLFDPTIGAYRTEHQKAQKLDLLYRCLETMGYQMSGDELAAQAGSWDGYDRADRAMKGFRERKQELDKRIYK